MFPHLMFSLSRSLIGRALLPVMLRSVHPIFLWVIKHLKLAIACHTSQISHP